MTPKKINSILVVEDDSAIREIMKTKLSSLGYNIDVADSGVEALGMLNFMAYDLVVSDISMPIMDGLTLYSEATERQPALKSRFIFITGLYNDKMKDFSRENFCPYLYKPFKMKELTDKVAEMENAAATAMNKRGEERIPLSTGCTISNSREIGAVTLDVSTSGMRVMYEGEPVTAGHDVSVSIKDPFIEMKARVMWSRTLNGEIHSGLLIDGTLPLNSLTSGTRPETS